MPIFTVAKLIQTAARSTRDRFVKGTAFHWKPITELWITILPYGITVFLPPDRGELTLPQPEPDRLVLDLPTPEG